MCKYCKVDENGENTDNYIFAPAKAKGLSSEIGLYLYADKKQIAAQVCYNGNPVSDEYTEFSVKYCPMCGRKL